VKGYFQAGIWILAQLFSGAWGSGEKTLLYHRSPTGGRNWAKLLIQEGWRRYLKEAGGQNY